MRFIMCGDTHGTFDLDKVTDYFDKHGNEYTRDDYLIILGDVAVCGASRSDEAETRQILNNLPVTVLFIDGNHENFDYLNSYPIVKWNGGKVHFVEDNIIHLMRGQVFDIYGTTFFTFGGAYSTDRNYRVEGVSWWPQEIPTHEEYEEGWNNLKKVDFKVDYICTHTAPTDVVGALGYGETLDEEVAFLKYLSCVADRTDFTAWYFGHFHEDECIEDVYHCLFETLEIIEK